MGYRTGAHALSLSDDEIAPPLAPTWYTDSEAFVYRQAYLEGYKQGRFDAHRKEGS